MTDILDDKYRITAYIRLNVNRFVNEGLWGKKEKIGRKNLARDSRKEGLLAEGK